MKSSHSLYKVSNSQSMQSRQFYLPKLHEPYPDPCLSAHHTDQAMYALTSARSYSSSQLSEDAFSSRSADRRGSPSSFYSTSSTGMQENRPLDRSLIRRASGGHAGAHLRQQTSSPALYMNDIYINQGSYEKPQTSLNARHQCDYCGKRFSRPSGLKVGSALYLFPQCLACS